MKITIAYLEDNQLNEVMKVLNPILSGAKIRKSDTYKPYKHAYITLKNSTKSSEIKEIS